MTHEKLAQRIEALYGPDREIDAEVMFDLYAKPFGLLEVDGGPRGYLWPDDHPSWSLGLRFPNRDREWFLEQRRWSAEETLLIERDGALVLMNSGRVPRLTASIDAADSVMPKGWEPMRVNWMQKGKCSVYANNGYYAIHAFAKTEALARLAAAVRAHGKGVE